MLPDPATAGSPDDLVARLRLLKIWAGDPSYEIIKERVNAAWTGAGRPASELARRSTVANCFAGGRRRFNTDLVVAVVEALHPDPGYVTQWRQALRVVGGETEAVSQVRVQDALPPDLASFTGRLGELERLRAATRAGDAVVISAIEGMAGVGKTQLAIHAGHLLHRQEPFQHVLFVNLRGFHPDPGQPPADPAAVLDGFLRLLGLPGQQIPHDLEARTAAYRKLLAGTRSLVVLDNAAGAGQIGPLVANVPGCLTLITSRRSTDLAPAVLLTVAPFSPAEALSFLAGALPGVPVGSDPDAATRIAGRCGHLPLALSLLAGHIRNTPGWTLTDHADRLDERHRQQRLESGVELALSLSCQHLPADRQRLLRLAALHPGQDLDGYAAAALTGSDLPTARAALADLVRDHLLQRVGAERYTLHDLVRAFAAARAHDEDPPHARRDALTRLFDHYVASAAAAMTTLHPAEAHRRPVVAPADSPAPDLSTADAAVSWLDVERPTLVAVAAHTAEHGWPAHTPRLARTLARYLNVNYGTDALIVHEHARHAAHENGDLREEGHALANLGAAHLGPGRADRAGDYLREALGLLRRAGDPGGQARVLFNLGLLAHRSGHYEEDLACQREALALYREAGDRIGEANTLNSLGRVLEVAGDLPKAIGCYTEAVELAHRGGDPRGEAIALDSLGSAETLTGRFEQAGEHLNRSVALFEQVRDTAGAAAALIDLGHLQTHLGRPEDALRCHRQALEVFRASGNRYLEALALNSIGESTLAAGRPAEALTHHEAAWLVATAMGARFQQIQARTGQGHAHEALGNHAEAEECRRAARELDPERTK